MRPKRLVFRLAYRKWRRRQRSPGYSMLMPMPHDLPLLLDLALRNLACQNVRHLNEVVVIPDVPTRAFQDAFDRIVRRHRFEIRLVERGPLETLMARLARGPGIYHFQQIKLGVDASRSEHVVLHDADLFLAPGDLLLRQYTTCVDRRLGVLGIEPRWGRRFRGFKAVATWEMFASVEWLQRFPPYLHLGGTPYPMENGTIAIFDTTLLPQYLSRDVIAVRETDAFVHFNHSISYYRTFTRAPASFHDDHFTLLLFRLLADAVDVPVDGLPALGDLDYRQADRNEYAAFRRDLERFLGFGLVDRDKLTAAVAPFDDQLGYVDVVPQLLEPSPVASVSPAITPYSGAEP